MWRPKISILTPVKGVTRKLQLSQFINRISILTPVKGVTVLIGAYEGCLYISILTPREGGDIGVDAEGGLDIKFQFSPP